MNIGKSHLYMLESIMHQNAECKWLKEWNENIRFFHAMVEGGRKRNSLRGLHVEGGWEEDPTKVKRCKEIFSRKIHRRRMKKTTT